MKLNWILGSLAALQLLTTFAFQLLVLAIVGAGAQTDAFVAAQAGPQVLFAVLVASMQSVWQPRLAVLSSDRRAWLHAQGTAHGQMLLLFGGVALALGSSASLWIPALFPGLGSVPRDLAQVMTLPLLAAALLTGHASLCTTAQRARDRFVGAEVAILLGSIAALAAAALIVPRYGVLAAAWIALGRAAISAVALHQLAGRPRVALRQALVDKASRGQLGPLLAGSSLYKTSPLLDRFWTSQAAAGGMTLFNLAQLGMGALASVIERAVSMPMAPRLARLVERRDWAAVRALYRRCVWRITVATAAAAILLLAAQPSWQRLTGALLNIDAAAAAQLWLVCLLLLGYLHVAASGTVVVAAFCAMGQASTPVRIGVAMFIVSIVVKSLGFIFWGLAGLAATTSAYYIVNMAVLSLLLEKKIDDHESA